jgi:hypothetical protein
VSAEGTTQDRLAATQGRLAALAAEIADLKRLLQSVLDLYGPDSTPGAGAGSEEGAVTREEGGRG